MNNMTWSKIGIAIVLISLALILYSCGASQKAKLNKMKNINEEDNIEVKVGDTFTYSFTSHGSVGYTGSQSIEDNTIVTHQDTEYVYDNPGKMKQGMSGADGSTGYFIFKAIKSGKTTIKFQVNFRGDIESETVKTIIVQ